MSDVVVPTHPFHLLFHIVSRCSPFCLSSATRILVHHLLDMYSVIPFSHLSTMFLIGNRLIETDRLGFSSRSRNLAAGEI